MMTIFGDESPCCSWVLAGGPRICRLDTASSVLCYSWSLLLWMMASLGCPVWCSVRLSSIDCCCCCIDRSSGSSGRSADALLWIMINTRGDSASPERGGGEGFNRQKSTLQVNKRFARVGHTLDKTAKVFRTLPFVREKYKVGHNSKCGHRRAKLS